jgi:predicted O-methyltransferase YrrM
MMRKALHRPDLGWRTRHVFGAAGLRPPIAQHTKAEAEILKHYASGSATIIELGVAEGGSAVELRSVLATDGVLYLVDPYEPGPAGISFAWVIAKRLVNSVQCGEVRWLRQRSAEAVADWDRPVDFLFIDADHSYERAVEDWRLWTPFVRSGGRVALHDATTFAGGWTDEEWGSVQLVKQVLAHSTQWALLDTVDSVVVLERKPT